MKRAMAMPARAMATTTRLEGKQQHPMARVLYLSASLTHDLVLLKDLSLDERGTRTNMIS